MSLILFLYIVQLKNTIEGRKFWYFLIVLGIDSNLLGRGIGCAIKWELGMELVVIFPSLSKDWKRISRRGSMSSSSILPQGLLCPMQIPSPLWHSLLSLLPRNISTKSGSFYYLSLAFFKYCCDDGVDMCLCGFTAIITYVNAETIS